MKILFQGDSITDAGRDKNDFHNMGPGYPGYAASLISQRHPEEEFEFINLGIGGHQTADLCNRWREDCTELMPDVVSVLIGINDVWHRAETRQWLDDSIFEKNYRFLLDEIKEKTDAKIIMLEPFLLYTKDKDFFREDLNTKIDIVRALAREYADAYIPLDGIFAAASVKAAPSFWAEDGVHPSDNGARLIARHYADAFDTLFK